MTLEGNVDIASETESFQASWLLDKFPLLEFPIENAKLASVLIIDTKKSIVERSKVEKLTMVNRNHNCFGIILFFLSYYLFYLNVGPDFGMMMSLLSTLINKRNSKDCTL